MLVKTVKQVYRTGNSLVQWLGPYVFTMKDTGSIPDCRTKTPQVKWPRKKKKQTNKRRELADETIIYRMDKLGPTV